MPCYTITTVDLMLLKADKGWLKSALVSLGYQINETKDFLRFSKDAYNRGSYEFSTGKLNIQSSNEKEAEQIGAKIKQAYSKELVLNTAQKYGWKNVTGQKTEVRQW